MYVYTCACVHMCVCVCAYVCMCVCMRVHVCVEKCKAIENFPMPLILLSSEALHMVAVNIIATCGLGHWKVYISLAAEW